MAKSVFNTPTIAQVSAFMAYVKPEWPKTFCDWYADKFWNTYQAKGWKISNSVAMKDWGAAFHSRWKESLREDVEKKLMQCLKEDKSRPVQAEMTYTPEQVVKSQEDAFGRTCSYIDAMLADFRQGVINRSAMASAYRWLKDCKYIKFSQEETQKLVADAQNDKEYGRYLSVKLFFTKLITDKQTFKQYAELQSVR